MSRRFLFVSLPLVVLGVGCNPSERVHPVAAPNTVREIPSFSIPSLPDGTACERFIAMGDMGTGRRDQYLVAEKMAEWAEANGLDFMVFLGDNILPNGTRSADDPQWKTKFEDVYADPALAVPVYAVLGNHEYRGNVPAQIEYGKRNAKWKMPARYYTFTRTLADATRVQFFVLDTTPIDKLEPEVDEQVAWLDRELSASAARWKICLGHHPLYHHNPRHEPNPRTIAKLEPLFTKHKVDLYMAGHHHALDMLKPIKGVYYVVSGGGGGPDCAREIAWTDGSYYATTGGGFAALRVSHDELVIEFVRMDGRTEYAHTLAARQEVPTSPR